ncbi:MAG: hypothetical protein AAFU54_10995 [Chloroflexota bacterium]
MKLRLLLAAAIIMVAAVAGVMAKDDPTTDIAAALDVAWLQVDDVQTVPIDGNDVLLVMYRTRELDPVAYRAEMIEIFRVVGQTGTVAERVSLVPQVDMGDTIEGLELATASTADIVQMATGSMTRTDFLKTIETVPLDHSRREPQEPA